MEVAFPQWAETNSSLSLSLCLNILLNVGDVNKSRNTRCHYGGQQRLPPSLPPPDSVWCSGRTPSLSVPTSTTTTATSPTAPSAVEAGKCSCVATTTAVGQYNAVYTLSSLGLASSGCFFLWPQQGFWFHMNRNNLPINVKTWYMALFIGQLVWSCFISVNIQFILASRLWPPHCKHAAAQHSRYWESCGAGRRTQIYYFSKSSSTTV